MLFRIIMIFVSFVILSSGSLSATGKSKQADELVLQFTGAKGIINMNYEKFDDAEPTVEKNGYCDNITIVCKKSGESYVSQKKRSLRNMMQIAGPPNSGDRKAFFAKNPASWSGSDLEVLNGDVKRLQQEHKKLGPFILRMKMKGFYDNHRIPYKMYEKIKVKGQDARQVQFQLINNRAGNYDLGWFKNSRLSQLDKIAEVDYGCGSREQIAGIFPDTISKLPNRSVRTPGADRNCFSSDLVMHFEQFQLRTGKSMEKFSSVYVNLIRKKWKKIYKTPTQHDGSGAYHPEKILVLNFEVFFKIKVRKYWFSSYQYAYEFNIYPIAAKMQYVKHWEGEGKQKSYMVFSLQNTSKYKVGDVIRDFNWLCFSSYSPQTPFILAVLE